MAGRSDFYSAKLPRYIKRMLTLDGTIGDRETRMAWIDAHAHHKRFKMKQNSSPSGRGSAADDTATE